MTMNDANEQAQVQPMHQAMVPVDSFRSTDVAIRQVDRAMALEHAFRHPRKLQDVVDKLRSIVLFNPASAHNSIYALPRAGKPIVGASVGFAYALLGSFTNCRVEPEHPEIDRKHKVVRCRACFVDLESNTEIWATATRRISNSKGVVYTDDMIAVTAQACVQIAIRNAILHGVFRPIWYPVFETCLITVRGAEATLPERRDEMLKSFAAHGVDPKRVAAALGVVKRDEITLDHLVVLQSMLDQLKEGEITAEEMFDPRKMTGWTPDASESPLSDEPEETGAGEAAGAAVQQAAQQASGTGQASPQAEPAPTHTPEGREGTRQGKPPREKPPLGPAPETAPAASAAPAVGQPATPEAYLTYASAWLQTEPTAFAIEARWRKERSLRNQIQMTSDERAPLEQAKKDRIAALNKAGG